MMRPWTDAAGRPWEIRITLAEVKRVKDYVSIDLLDFETGRGVMEMTGDILKFADVLYAVLMPQADAAGIGPEAFAEGLAGDSFNEATKLFVDELIDFFPNPQTRTLLRENVKQLSQIFQKRFAGAISSAKSKKHAKSLEVLVDATLGKTSTGSPASPV